MQVRACPLGDTPADGQGTAGRRGLHHDVQGLPNGTPLQLRQYQLNFNFIYGLLPVKRVVRQNWTLTSDRQLYGKWRNYCGIPCKIEKT